MVPPSVRSAESAIVEAPDSSILDAWQSITNVIHAQEKDKNLLFEEARDILEKTPFPDEPTLTNVRDLFDTLEAFVDFL
jgi:hypothetical protein